MANDKNMNKAIKEKQASIFDELRTLSRKHGSDVFRIVGQRFFAKQREQDHLRAEITAREAELRRLQQKAAVR